MKTKDIPGEVWGVWGLINSGIPVGTETHKMCMEIIDKYPEHFPWQHKYKSIPEEVHEAYRKEMGHDWDSILKKMPLFDGNKKSDGIMSEIKKSFDQQNKQREENKNKSIHELLKEAFDDIDRMEDDRRKEVMKRREIWNKHYKKYNLEFIPEAHERKYYP